MIRRRDTNRDIENLDDLVYDPAKKGTINYKFKSGDYEINKDCGFAGGSCNFKVKEQEISYFLSSKGFSALNITISKITNDKYTWRCEID
jgi:hypothetical protein